MESPSLLTAVGKLAINAQSAGMSLEDVIELLGAGLAVDALLWLIASSQNGTPTPDAPPSLRRIT